ncbi:MAG: STAS domain-containing protein [Acidimicrobiia bacterium]
MGQSETDMPASAPARSRRRWFGRPRAALAASDAAGGLRVATPSDELSVWVRHGGQQQVSVVVSGLLVRQHTHLIDDVLTRAFADDRAWFVIDLRGVIRLDPTALAAITRRIDEVRRRGALVTIVPPGRATSTAA